jgi:hypothetical protein
MFMPQSKSWCVYTAITLSAKVGVYLICSAVNSYCRVTNVIRDLFDHPGLDLTAGFRPTSVIPGLIRNLLLVPIMDSGSSPE